MSWNYRVVRYQGADKEWYCGIHEVYYDEDKPSGHTVREAGVSGESIDELRDILKKMGEALDKPILEFKPESGYREVGSEEA